MSDNFFSDNDDLQFYFDEGFDWAPLVEVTEYGFRAEGCHPTTKAAVDFYREVATMVGEFAATKIAPFSAEIDREGVLFEGGEARLPPRLSSIFEEIRGLELHGMCLPRELGGMNAPLILYLIHSELLARAEVSTMAHHGFHGGMAMAMLIFSIKEGSTTFDPARARITETRFQSYIDEIARGDAWGCMDITEPDAGSDMARLRAKGEVDEAGRWLVTGQKIFITSGHGKYHFVIARTEPLDTSNPLAGLKGLSMFLVPTYEEEGGVRRRIVALDRVEEKLGHHGSVTAALSFERAPAHLIGKRGEGFSHMLTLMNNARLGVGFESIGLCEAALRAAKAYAAGRVSMGKPIAEHEMIADLLDEMDTDVRSLRALAMTGAFAEEMSQKLTLALTFDMAKEREAEIKRALPELKATARRVTPLLKYLASEKAVEMARRCVQIHGGNGYTRDYPGEKLLRDAMVMPIYEGTSQIQSLMAMKDTLTGIMKDPQGFYRRLAASRVASLRGDGLAARVAGLQWLSLSAQHHLITRTAFAKLRSLGQKPVASWKDELTKNWDPKRDFSLAMLHAERLTRLLADELIAEILLAQAEKHPGRRWILEAHLDRAEPRARHLHDEITTTGRRLLDRIARREGAAKAAE